MLSNTSAGCKHCLRAVRGLREAGWIVDEIRADASRQVWEALKEEVNSSTVPQVFVGAPTKAGAGSSKPFVGVEFDVESACFCGWPKAAEASAVRTKPS